MKSTIQLLPLWSRANAPTSSVANTVLHKEFNQAYYKLNNIGKNMGNIDGHHLREYDQNNFDNTLTRDK